MCKSLLRPRKVDLVCLTEVGFKPKANQLHHTDYRVYFNHMDSTPCTQGAKTKSKQMKGLDKNPKFCRKESEAFMS